MTAHLGMLRTCRLLGAENGFALPRSRGILAWPDIALPSAQKGVRLVRQAVCNGGP
ncbi:hypothetical protein HNR30_008840 [Nonomuraea soli]|uniref:Uncharacterized protein n=1 Tax=Nonomuraea soli TaxID=1032476 RepID=A0A7W0HVU9_9ACTN|nr:hypothetical protein [Nonomuraea soli]